MFILTLFNLEINSYIMIPGYEPIRLKPTQYMPKYEPIRPKSSDLFKLEYEPIRPIDPFIPRIPIDDSQYTDIPSPPQIERERTLTYSFQGNQGSCFAHAAAHVIFHNLYRLPLTKEDRLLYLDNKCYSLLNTTNPEIENAIELEKRCGKTSAIRILLFLYIYKTITNHFGCNGGIIEPSVHYFLNLPNQPSFTNMSLNDYVLPTLTSVNKNLFGISTFLFNPVPTIHVKKFLKQYFDDNYYCVLTTRTPPHGLTIIGMNSTGLLGKDSASHDQFTIPWEQFHQNGVFTIHTKEYRNLRSLVFVYEKTSIKKYNKEFRFLLKEAMIKTGGTRKTKHIKRKTKHIKRKLF